MQKKSKTIKLEITGTRLKCLKISTIMICPKKKYEYFLKKKGYKETGIYKLIGQYDTLNKTSILLYLHTKAFSLLFCLIVSMSFQKKKACLLGYIGICNVDATLNKCFLLVDT